jgi:hypothetical protein
MKNISLVTLTAFWVPSQQWSLYNAMKKSLLWLIGLIILIQAYIVIEAMPELHVLSADEYMKQTQEFSAAGLPVALNVGTLETHEYHNGKIGKYLGTCILITDSTMIVLLVFAIAGDRKQRAAAD